MIPTQVMKTPPRPSTHQDTFTPIPNLKPLQMSNLAQEFKTWKNPYVLSNLPYLLLLPHDVSVHLENHWIIGFYTIMESVDLGCNSILP